MARRGPGAAAGAHSREQAPICDLPRAGRRLRYQNQSCPLSTLSFLKRGYYTDTGEPPGRARVSYRARGSTRLGPGRVARSSGTRHLSSYPGEV